jgi:hypothetical protein
MSLIPGLSRIIYSRWRKEGAIYTYSRSNEGNFIYLCRGNVGKHLPQTNGAIRIVRTVYKCSLPACLGIPGSGSYSIPTASNSALFLGHQTAPQTTHLYDQGPPISATPKPPIDIVRSHWGVKISPRLDFHKAYIPPVQYSTEQSIKYMKWVGGPG